MGARKNHFKIFLIVLFGLGFQPYWAGAETNETNSDDAMLAVLQQMVAEHPERGDTWRMIGRIYRKQNRAAEAMDACRRALQIQPDNAAAHFDLGEMLSDAGQTEEATKHFTNVLELAPVSGYADQLRQRGFAPPASNVPLGMPTFSPPGMTIPNMNSDSLPFGEGESNVQPAGFEIQTFDGSDDLERRLNQLEADALPTSPRLRTFIETGVLYNSNVSLTPISRELTSDNQGASLQVFFSPDIEWSALQRGPWRMGPLMRGYFTKNEDSFREFDLASYQPGAFLEREFGPWNSREFIFRMDYVYALDLLNGDRFGNRHSMTASVTTILPCADAVYTYFTTSFADFEQDGANPAVDSLDGATFTTGISRFFTTESSRVPMWSIGGDLEFANTDGADFRYHAVNFHSDATIKLRSNVLFIPRGGVGYRGYDDFTGTVNRDELTSRIGGRLQWNCRDSLSISLVVNHDRFASDNVEFDTERTEGGIVLTLIR